MAVLVVVVVVVVGDGERLSGSRNCGQAWTCLASQVGVNKLTILVRHNMHIISLADRPP